MTPLEAADHHRNMLKDSAKAKKDYELAKTELEEAEAMARLALPETTEDGKKITVPMQDAMVILDEKVKETKRTVHSKRFDFDNAEAEAIVAGEIVWILHGESKQLPYPV